MPRAKNDHYKRACAQAIGHIAAAIVRIDQFRIPMSEQHPEERDELMRIEAGLVAVRQHLLIKVHEWWNLDEDSLRVYLG